MPPAIQADLYRVRAERQIEAGEHAEALATLDRLVALQTEHDLEVPGTFWFEYAQVALGAGVYEKASTSAIRYLETDGTGGHTLHLGARAA